MSPKEKNMLTITHSVQPQFAIDAETAGQYEGTAEDVLTRLIREHGNPELCRELEDPNVILEAFGHDESGESLEMPVSPTSDWKNVVNLLKHADAEFGLAKSHVGGLVSRLIVSQAILKGIPVC